MNVTKIQSVLIVCLLLVTIIPFSQLLSAPTDSARSIPADSSVAGAPKDVLIINDPSKLAFFGWYRPTAFSTTILNLLNRTIQWASSYSAPNMTRIAFFSEANDTYAAFVRTWLLSGGYLQENIVNYTSADIEEFPASHYSDFDLVIYWNTYGYDPINVIDSKVPFITASATQTTVMGIGSGVVTQQSINDTFYVVNNNYYPTQSYPIGSVLLDDSYRFEATAASSTSKALVKSEVLTPVTKLEESTVENVTINNNGSADFSFNITAPESPLAEALRQAFFANTSSLQTGATYEVPTNKTISYSSTAEQGIKDVALLGDVNGDGRVDSSDLESITSHVGYALGDQGFNSTFDLNWDGQIDMRDVAAAARNYGKTVNNTGSLYIAGYYNGELVNCTDVFYAGPEDSLPVNTTAAGRVWYYLLPGEYRINGTYDGIEKSTNITVLQGQTVYAQLDFEGTSAPPVQTQYEPVRDGFYQGIAMEQLVLLGFNMNVTDSTIVPYSTSNSTIITLAGNSSQLAKVTTYPNWQISIGPTTDNLTSSAAEFIFTKIQYMMIMLQSIPGEQVYNTTWQIGIDLPSGSTLLNQSTLQGLNWTIDFGEGTYMQTNVSVISGRVVIDERTVVTEHNITATEAYLISALGSYRRFSINYTYSGGVPLAQLTTVKLHRDWSKTWSYVVAPNPFKKTINLGPLAVTLTATPTLATQWYLGWERSWSRGRYHLDWFEAWMKITPSIKVEASASVSASYTKTWDYVFWTWSTRFTFWVGGLVVWANLKLQVTGGITVDAHGEISISTSAEAHAWYKAGVKWNGGWSTIWYHGYGASRGTPVIRGSASLTVTPEASCRLSFLLYDAAGPFVEATPYVPMSINYYTYKRNTWSIQLKLKISVGVTLSGWLQRILKLDEYSRVVADFTLESWSGYWP